MELRKKVNEIIALYKLESELCDLYVEGQIDKQVLENYLKSKNNPKKVIPIELIDFAELPENKKFGLDIKSNRNKVIILSQLIQESIPKSKIKCIVDKDFADFIETMQNEKLLMTDFSCLEAYLFCEEVIQKFLEIGLANFPNNGKEILSELEKVLKPLFCIRLLRELEFKDAQLLKIDSHLNVNKKAATINFDVEDYLIKFIQKNNLSKQQEYVFTTYKNLISKFTLDIRNYIHGHDFISIFYLYINSVKNTNKYKEDNIDKVLFLTAESKMLDKYGLFSNILN